MTDTKSIKSYTPGAESAARKLCRDWTGIPTPADVAEIISRETHDTELLEALQACMNMVDGDGHPPDWDAIRAIIAKVEGH